MLRVFLLVSFLAVEIFGDEAQDIWAARQRHVKPAGKTGAKISGRIVGGVEVDVSKYPFQLSLRDMNFHICGATAIAELWALTAAHCYSPPIDPRRLTLLGGTNQRDDDFNGSVFQVDEVICHPKFDATTYDKDVCVMHVTTSFLGYPNIGLIPIAHSGQVVASNSYATVSGWGLLASDKSLAPTLRAVTIPITSMKNCKEVWVPYTIATSAICAGQQGKDSCNGDSGGPLVQNGTQIGLVSWGNSECGSPLPGIYTFIGNPKIRSFINKYTGV
ncbi:trypsin 3A1-like [Anopheles ziemanni]|uniref:trypsin 3A1-like n=1 Tax=Anopheles coustani TaxID=139045 RepID=UPI002659A5DE|nr:trypsin 3A1-like [Anopheles coustani]XP_058174122.1 trypsin 3A1-like [Anopheles ziemanni]